MIITCHLQLIVGKIYTEKDLVVPFTYKRIEHKTYSFLVIREATLEEFREDVLKTDPENASEVMELEFYYKISID